MEVILTNEGIAAPPLDLPSREIGACVEFWGIVREQEDGRALTGLHYEAYEAMARRELQKKYPISQALVIHRLGWVPVGEPSLFVRVLAKNRGPALAFCGELIDLMKVAVPIWKLA